MAPQEFKRDLLATAETLGFVPLGVVRLDDKTQSTQMSQAGQYFQKFLAKKQYGTMAWLAKRTAQRIQAKALWSEAQSIVMLGANYAPAQNPLARIKQKRLANISVYAQGRDYHLTLKKQLKQLALWHKKHAPAEALKYFVDTAPILEKPLAMSAGGGWQGKHTNLVSREYGSWLFLASLWTTLRLPADTPHKDKCGSCRACLDVCPTDAFPAPYQLDARRCISYLTIEHKGLIPLAFRKAIGNRIYGCDDCLAVCPWNKYAKTASPMIERQAEFAQLDLATLVELSEEAFRAKFSRTPIKRVGRAGFIRNVLIAMGNANTQDYIPLITARLRDSSAVVRGTAVWALAQYLSAQELAPLAPKNERDKAVQAEWEAVL